MGGGVEIMSYGFSKFRKTESPVFSASQVDKYDRPNIITSVSRSYNSDYSTRTQLKRRRSSFPSKQTSLYCKSTTGL